MKKTSNKYGFFATFSIIFAGVVGVGIFFKGETVMSLTHSGLLMIIAWSFVSLIALGLAFSYIEISSSTVKNEESEQGSLYNWSSKFWNKRFGSFVGIFYCFFYMPLNLIALGLISSRMFVNLFVGAGSGIIDAGANNYNDWATQNQQFQMFYGIIVYLIAMMLIFFFIAVNSFGTKFSKGFQSMGTVVKIVLLVLVIAMISYGLASGINSTVPDPGGDLSNGYDDTFVGDPQIGGFFLALPAVMFSLDGFVMSGTLQSDTKKKKTFSRALISAMLTIILLYLFVILGSSLIRNSAAYDVPGIINTVFGDLPVFQLFLLALITLSGISATNSWFIYLGRTIYDLADNKEIVNNNSDLNYKHEQTGAYTYAYRLALSVISIYLVCFLILDLTLFPYANGVDVRSVFGNVEIASTDLIVMMMFGVYGIIVLGGVKNHKTNKVAVDRTKGFTPVSIAVIVALAFVIISYVVSVPISYVGVGSNELQMNDANFGSFWALPIDILLILILLALWQWLHIRTKQQKLDDDGDDKDQMDNYYNQKVERWSKNLTAEDQLNQMVENSSSSISDKFSNYFLIFTGLFSCSRHFYLKN